MPETGKRTTVVLDSEDADDLAFLAKHWKTSQMEVIRRAIREAANAESLRSADRGR
jgi:predicted transcriptional regulator